MADLISSATNPVAKRVRRLADARHRRREGAFVVEGVAPVWHAIDAGANVEQLLIAPELLGTSPASMMVMEQEARGVRVARLSADLFARLSGRDGPSGLAAIVRAAPCALDDLVVGPGSVFVAAHKPANPGNLGTIVRTGEAFGAAGLILSGPGADPYAPQAVKASMGSLFHLPIARAGTLDDVFSWAGDRGLATVTTSARADATLDDVMLRAPLLIVLGPERTGLSDEELERGDYVVRIPMSGHATSLNLAVAAGILLHEIYRRLPRA